MSLVFRSAPGEVPGELVFTARADGYDFTLTKEPHRDDWAWIVTDAADGFPVDLGASVATKEDAMAACEAWLKAVRGDVP